MTNPFNRTVRTVQNAVFDETFVLKKNALRTYDVLRKKGGNFSVFTEETSEIRTPFDSTRMRSEIVNTLTSGPKWFPTSVTLK